MAMMTVSSPPRRKVHRSPGRPTKDQAEARNEELLDKALDLFLTQGFERTTIEAITAAVGMAKRTVYARYGDKETLFKAALQRAIGDWIVPVEQLKAAETDDLEETLLAIGMILVSNIVSPSGLRLMQINNAESARMAEIGEYTLLEGTGPTVAYLAELLRQRLPGKFSDEPREADALAYAFLHLVAGGPANIMAWGVKLSDEEVALQTRIAVRLFLHGVLH